MSKIRFTNLWFTQEELEKNIPLYMINRASYGIIRATSDIENDTITFTGVDSRSKYFDDVDLLNGIYNSFKIRLMGDEKSEDKMVRYVKAYSYDVPLTCYGSLEDGYLRAVEYRSKAKHNEIYFGLKPDNNGIRIYCENSEYEPKYRTIPLGLLTCLVSYCRSDIIIPFNRELVDAIDKEKVMQYHFLYGSWELTRSAKYSFANNQN